MLTDKLVFENSGTLSGDQLHEQVTKYIDLCVYSYRLRRIRHSQGLFPPKPQSSEDVHIRRQIGINDTKEIIIGKFKAHGYYVENSSRTSSYLRQTVGNCTPEEVIVADEGLSKVLWAH